ncbi:MAG: hypothetical protein NVSMB27_08080 [Ktedonobacteraceae bacterium]
MSPGIAVNLLYLNFVIGRPFHFWAAFVAKLQQLITMGLPFVSLRKIDPLKLVNLSVHLLEAV